MKIFNTTNKQKVRVKIRIICSSNECKLDRLEKNLEKVQRLRKKYPYIDFNIEVS